MAARDLSVGLYHEAEQPNNQHQHMTRATQLHPEQPFRRCRADIHLEQLSTDLNARAKLKHIVRRSAPSQAPYTALLTLPYYHDDVDILALDSIYSAPLLSQTSHCDRKEVLIWYSVAGFLVAEHQLPLLATPVIPLPSPSPSVATTRTSQIPVADTAVPPPSTEWLAHLPNAAANNRPVSTLRSSHCQQSTPSRISQVASIIVGSVGSSLSRIWSILQASDSKYQRVTPPTLFDDPRHVFTHAATSSSRSDEADDDLRVIPKYVLEYAPYVHLYSEEEYWPGLMQVHLDHTTPYINYTPVDDKLRNRNLDNLDELNGLGRMYLQSNDDPESYPDWLGGRDNIPPDFSMSATKRRRSRRATSEPHRSPAPATLLVVDKGDYLDAFWFFFYSFNLGNQVLGVRFGNHVGDWEHTVIRFSKMTGKPIEVFYSEHEWGAAYKWEDAEKHDDKRMLTYSAFGTHAMYRTSGVQRYVLPFGLLQDITDRGPLWDPTLNLYAYTYDPSRDIVRASDLTPDVPENWFHFSGHWGDKYYPMDDPRQYRFAGELHYDSGPTGPKFKNLGRSHICQNEDTCLKHIDLAQRNQTIVITNEMWQAMQKLKRARDNVAR